MPETASTISTLQQTLRAQRPGILDHWRQLLAAAGATSRGHTQAQELQSEMQTLLDELIDALADEGAALAQGGQHPLARTLRNASELRAGRGYTPEESLQYLQTCKEALQQAASAASPSVAAAQAASQCLSRLMDRCVLLMASSFLRAREAIVASQGEALREVATPVITLWDSMLLLPLVGIVDSVRAQLISERLLLAVSESEAEVTLIDVTGVPVMDTSVARHILKTVTAAEMLGTRVILTGISPSTAQTMVKLGIDMSGVPTRASLKSGLSLALTMTRRRIVSNGDDATGAV